jgi:NTE family protein
MASRTGGLALVMSGGGARATYQVGFLRWLARHYPDLKIPILTGVSAGAINAAYLANHRGSFRKKVEDLAEIWAEITTDHVFRVDPISIARNVISWGARLVMGRASRIIRAYSLVDASPFGALLEALLQPVGSQLVGIQKNLDRGELRAIAITTSSYSTGQSITWVQGEDVTLWERGHRKALASTLTLDHILASASLPIFFPAVLINGHWYGDGEIRMTAPLSPAIHLGADRILAIATRYGRSPEEADRPSIDHYPPPVQVIGALFNAIFLDVFDYDALRLERINQLVVNLPEEKRAGMRPIKLLLLRPSRDMGMLAGRFESRLPCAFRFMTRGLGTLETRSNDILSLLMFQPDYLKALLDLGYADAEARKDEIAAFLTS